ncbi:MAG: HEAT repeat domain-containing protein [Pirellulales bacterium]|nr:HEAT repeat domain-containing protein [Pirellulales bacterium]
MKHASRMRVGILALAFTVGVIEPLVGQEVNDELVDLVVGLLAEKDKDIRALGLEQVRSAGKSPEATKKFSAQLAKLSPDAQIALLSALADRGDRAARADVVALLNATESPDVRVAAVKALGPLGEPDDAALLMKLMRDKSKDVAANARQSLTDLRGDSVSPAIAKAMSQQSSADHIALLQVLAARRAFDSVPSILESAVHSDAAISTTAMKALGQLAGPEHIAGMVQGVLKAADSRERAGAEKCIMFACARVNDPERRADALLAAMEQLDEEDRRKMLSTLGRVGGSKALEVVEQAIASGDKKLHELGIKALCNWPDASVAPRLMELSNTLETPSHKIATLRALIRVAPLKDERSDAGRLQILDKAMVMAARDDEKKLALDRARGIRTVDSLRFILPYTDQPKFAEQACLSIVELAHHRGLRVPNQKEFDKALDKVIATSKDPVVVDRAQRYKKDQTWVRPK